VTQRTLHLVAGKELDDRRARGAGLIHSAEVGVDKRPTGV
jgi:hypothetical protein